MRSIMAGKQDGVFVTLYILLFSFSCRPLFFYYTHTQQQQQQQQRHGHGHGRRRGPCFPLVVCSPSLLSSVSAAFLFLFGLCCFMRYAACLPPFSLLKKRLDTTIALAA